MASRNLNEQLEDLQRMVWGVRGISRTLTATGILADLAEPGTVPAELLSNQVQADLHSALEALAVNMDHAVEALLFPEPRDKKAPELRIARTA